MENEQPPTRWWSFVQEHLDQRGWSGADFERASHIGRSRLVSWRQGAVPSVEMARAVALTFGVSIPTAFVAAEFATPEELGVEAVVPLDLTKVPTMGLLRELGRRAGESVEAVAELDAKVSTAGLHPPTREEIAANPRRYVGPTKRVRRGGQEGEGDAG